MTLNLSSYILPMILKTNVLVYFKPVDGNVLKTPSRCLVEPYNDIFYGPHKDLKS